MGLKKENFDQNRAWAVYVHRNKINGKRYVGITSNLKLRWRNGGGYRPQPYFWRAIQKYGCNNFEHEILLQNETHEYACKAERCLIKHYKTKNPLYGYNLTDGGDGPRGLIVTEETRQKMSESHKGKKLPDEQKKMLSETRIGEKNPYYNKKHSEESRKKMSIAGKGRPKTQKFKDQMSQRVSGAKNPMAKYPVYCINTGEVFWGAKGASNQYTHILASNISAVCRGKTKHAGKHPTTHEPLGWLYLYDQECEDGSIIKGAITLGLITEEEALSQLSEM